MSRYHYSLSPSLKYRYGGSRDPASAIARLEAILDAPTENAFHVANERKSPTTMDPLSFTASIIAVVTIAVQVAQNLQKLKAIHDAPNALCAVINEVTDLRLVLSEINTIVDSQGSDGEVLDPGFSCISSIAKQIKTNLLQLDNLIHTRLLKAPIAGNDHQVRRIAWIRERSNVLKIQEKLRTLRLDLVATIGARSLYREPLSKNGEH